MSVPIIAIQPFVDAGLFDQTKDLGDVCWYVAFPGLMGVARKGAAPMGICSRFLATLAGGASR